MSEELERVLNRVQDLATIINDVTFQLRGHIKDTQRPLEDFQRLVMDPESGVIVKLRHLERTVQLLDGEVAKLVARVPTVMDLDARLQAIEKRQREGLETRRWLTRDVVVMGTLTVVTSTLVGLLVARLT